VQEFAVTSYGELVTFKRGKVILYDAEGAVLRALTVPLSRFRDFSNVKLSASGVTLSSWGRYSAFTFWG
jgi:hypothetical protein